jgi:hypothetical protein
MSSQPPTIARAFSELPHPLCGPRVFVLGKEPLAHAVHLAAPQAFVELAAVAEGAHHHIGRGGEQAQVLFGARCAAAKIALDQGVRSICLRVLDQQFHVFGIPKTWEFVCEVSLRGKNRA